MSQYKERYLIGLDMFGEGNHYNRHVQAMTKEGLDSKSDIAAELGVRDAQIQYLLGVIYMMDQDVHMSMVNLIPNFELNGKKDAVCDYLV